MLYAIEQFNASIDGVEIVAKSGEMIDKDLAPRVVAKLKARGLITDKKPKAIKETKED